MSKVFLKKEVKLYGSVVWMGFHCLKATKPLRGVSLLFTTKSRVVSRTHLIDRGWMEGRVNLGATRLF